MNFFAFLLFCCVFCGKDDFLSFVEIDKKNDKLSVSLNLKRKVNESIKSV